MKVYEVNYDHQYQGMSYGLFSTLEKAKEFLKNTLKVDISKEIKTIYGFRYEEDYVVTERHVND